MNEIVVHYIPSTQCIVLIRHLEYQYGAVTNYVID